MYTKLAGYVWKMFNISSKELQLKIKINQMSGEKLKMSVEDQKVFMYIAERPTKGHTINYWRGGGDMLVWGITKFHHPF